MGQYHRHLPLTAHAPAGHRLIDSREGNFKSSGLHIKYFVNTATKTFTKELSKKKDSKPNRHHDSKTL